MQCLRSKIILENIRIYGYHGVLPEENIIGTYYLINLEVEADIWKATKSDNIHDTLSYAVLNDIIHEEMKIKSRLLEHVAGRIITKIYSRFPEISSIKIKLTKTSPPMKGECEGASVEFETIYQ